MSADDIKVKTSFTFALDDAQKQLLKEKLSSGNYLLKKPAQYVELSAAGNNFTVQLYTSGKCLVQGKGAMDFVLFVMEPEILRRAGEGYEALLHPETVSPHIGSDESGKGDFFGPLVTSAVYVNPETARQLAQCGVQDCKKISDAKCLSLANEIRRIVGKGKYTFVMMRPETYNRLHASMGNVNLMLAWAHARGIENVLEAVPDCPRAVADQFGNERLIKNALMEKGKKITIEQHHRAESDIAVASASVLARAAFLHELRLAGERLGMVLPKGCSAQVKEVARALFLKFGKDVLLSNVKCSFKTAAEVMAGK